MYPEQFACIARNLELAAGKLEELVKLVRKIDSNLERVLDTLEPTQQKVQIPPNTTYITYQVYTSAHNKCSVEETMATDKQASVLIPFQDIDIIEEDEKTTRFLLLCDAIYTRLCSLPAGVIALKIPDELRDDMGVEGKHLTSVQSRRKILFEEIENLEKMGRLILVDGPLTTK